MSFIYILQTRNENIYNRTFNADDTVGYLNSSGEDFEAQKSKTYRGNAKFFWHLMKFEKRITMIVNNYDYFSPRFQYQLVKQNNK